MNYFDLDFFGLKRKLPIVPLTPKIKIASFSLLGDAELTEKATEKNTLNVFLQASKT